MPAEKGSRLNACTVPATVKSAAIINHWRCDAGKGIVGYHFKSGDLPEPYYACVREFTAAAVPPFTGGPAAFVRSGFCLSFQPFHCSLVHKLCCITSAFPNSMMSLSALSGLM